MKVLTGNVVAKRTFRSQLINKSLFKILLKFVVILGFSYFVIVWTFNDQLDANYYRKVEKNPPFRSMLDFRRGLFVYSNVNTNDSIHSYMLNKSIENRTNLKKAATPQISKLDQCNVKIPDIAEIDYNNIYWQHFVSSNATYFLYNAYYDNRRLGGPSPLVRITAMINRVYPPPIFCQLWYTNVSFPVVTRASYSCIWAVVVPKYHDGMLLPYLVTCPIPSVNDLVLQTLVPQSVSLVIKSCDQATNNLRIINNRPVSEKKQFAVCVKGLDYYTTDVSARVVEWIELLHLLGAEKIFFYKFDIHSNLSKVIKYYLDKQMIEVQELSLPGSQPNRPESQFRYFTKYRDKQAQNELIPYNDCLYKNMYSYHYVVLLDIDEVIIPFVHANWSQFIAEVQKVSFKERNTPHATYSVENVYFFDDFGGNNSMRNYTDNNNDYLEIPSYLHMLKHIYRSNKYVIPIISMKSFFDTERVVTLTNHYALSCFGSCISYMVPIRLGHVQHYRRDCQVDIQAVCEKEYRKTIVRDTTIWRYKRELTRRAKHALTELGFIIS